VQQFRLVEQRAHVGDQRQFGDELTFVRVRYRLTIDLQQQSAAAVSLGRLLMTSCALHVPQHLGHFVAMLFRESLPHEVAATDHGFP
jgi:hypothetical protein